MAPAEKGLVIQLDGCESRVSVPLDDSEEINLTQDERVRGILEQVKIVGEARAVLTRRCDNAAKLIEMLFAPLPNMNQR